MISIVMTAWKRAHLLRPTLESIRLQPVSEELEIIVVEDGYDGGATREACHDFSALYIQRKRRPELRYSNPAVPINLGLRAAAGDVILLQNAECRHDAPDVIERLVAPVREDENAVTFAQVQALGPDGSFLTWYLHDKFRHEAFFFCGAARREVFHNLRGFDEEFVGYGYDDTAFGWLLGVNGYKLLYTDVPVSHQWHEQTGCPGLESNYERFVKFIREVMSGAPPVSNRGRDWGVPEQ